MDRTLVTQAIEGDRGAFSTLMRASMPRQYAVALLILGDTNRAEDAVQEAYVAAWQGMAALRKPEAWEAWLHRLLVRACFRLVRREKRRRLVELHVTPDPEPASPDDPYASAIERDRLQRELEHLPVDQRAIVVLRFYADLPLDEVADILGVPVGTAKSRQHRAIQALRSSMVRRSSHRTVRTAEGAS